MNDHGISVQNFRIASNTNEAEEISHSFRMYLLSSKLILSCNLNFKDKGFALIS